jgi:hypothetical protein
MRKIVALTGHKGSGKDTAALYFMSRGFTNMKFAGALKDMIATLIKYQGGSTRLIADMIEGHLKEVPSNLYLGGKSPREAMILLGTEWARDLINEELWVNTLVNRVQATSDYVVITDCRFDNEEKAIRDLGGKIIRIVRPDNASNVFQDHPSEAYIPKMNVDLEIVNDGTIEALHEAVVNAMVELYK